MNTLLQDLRLALRQIRRSPGFALTAILTLALGIAANVIVFGVVRTLVLKPLEVPHPDRFFTIGPKDGAFPAFSFPEVRDLRDANAVFSAVAAENMQSFGLDANGTTRPAWGYEVSGQYFQAFGIQPLLGRLLQPADDDHPGASTAAVLSFPAWKSTFAADPNIVGKLVRINKQPYTIVGVAPQGFHGSVEFLQPDLFVPMANEASLEGVAWLDDRNHHNEFAIVRLKDGVTLPQVQADLDSVASRITRAFPREEEKLSFKLTRPGLIGDFLGGPARAFMAGIMGLAAIVLLAACANLGSLFAARTADRTRDIAIRMAIGSSRWRIVRQVLVEAFVIAVLGGIAACILAWIALSGLASWQPPTDYPITFAVTPQPGLILIALLVSLAAGALFGLMPLRQIFHTDPNDAIKSGASSSSTTRRWALRDILLAAQIALCCVTVTAAFVSLRGMSTVLHQNLGFNPNGAVLATFDLSTAGYTLENSPRLQRQLLDRIAALPGVQTVGYADTTPFGNVSLTAVFAQQTTDFRPSNQVLSPFVFSISPKFLEAAGTPLLAGRDVSFTDTSATPRVAIVTREFVRQFFHATPQQAVGRFFKQRSGTLIQIVGVAGDGKYLSLSEDPKAAVFFPVSQQPSTAAEFVIRSRPGESTQKGAAGQASDPVAAASLSATVREIIRQVDPAIPIRACSEWSSQMGMPFFPARVATISLGLFGAFGLLLSITGTFGLASYTVSKRLRELSIRVALGAQRRQILAAALGRMAILLATGGVVGMALGAATSRLLSAIVYHASAQDPTVLAAVVLTMLLTGALSVAAPVRRALRVDPAILLREE